mgnify:CR=1 FL=1
MILGLHAIASNVYVFVERGTLTITIHSNRTLVDQFNYKHHFMYYPLWTYLNIVHLTTEITL